MKHKPDCVSVLDDESDYEHLADAGTCTCGASRETEGMREDILGVMQKCEPGVGDGILFHDGQLTCLFGESVVDAITDFVSDKIEAEREANCKVICLYCRRNDPMCTTTPWLHTVVDVSNGKKVWQDCGAFYIRARMNKE